MSPSVDDVPQSQAKNTNEAIIGAIAETDIELVAKTDNDVPAKRDDPYLVAFAEPFDAEK